MDTEARVVSVRMHLPDLYKMRALASVDEKSVGDLIRSAVSEYVTKRLSEPDTQDKITKAEEKFNAMLALLKTPMQPNK